MSFLTQYKHLKNIYLKFVQPNLYKENNKFLTLDEMNIKHKRSGKKCSGYYVLKS